MLLIIHVQAYHKPPLPFLSSKVYICHLQVMYSSTRSQQDRSQTWGGQKEANVTGVGFGYQISKLSWGGGLSWQSPTPTCMHYCLTPSPPLVRWSYYTRHWAVMASLPTIPPGVTAYYLMAHAMERDSCLPDLAYHT